MDIWRTTAGLLNIGLVLFGAITQAMSLVEGRAALTLMLDRGGQAATDVR